MQQLEQKDCVPCGKGGAAMAPEAVQLLLDKLNDWSIKTDTKWLEKSFKFKDFKQSLHFVNKVGEIAESQNHHPDISFGWGYVTIRLQTHAVGGLHENDFIVAAKIDALTSSLSS